MALARSACLRPFVHCELASTCFATPSSASFAATSAPAVDVFTALSM